MRLLSILVPLPLLAVTLHGQQPAQGDKPAREAREKGAQHKVDFVKDIVPIFKARCYECHAGEEEEGDVKLDSRENIFDPGRDDPILVPGKPDDSPLYQRLVLPEDDPDIMPADGDPLTKAQIATIKRWIEEGASWPSSADPKPVKEREVLRVPELSEDAKRAEGAALTALSKMGATAMPIAKNSNATYVNLGLLGKKAGDAEVQKLHGLEPSLVWLNLGRTSVGDAGVEKLAAFRELRRLHLEKTAVTDAGLSALSGLDKLEYLNLYGTGIGDAGLQALEGLKSLRKLFLWQTKVTGAGVAKLQKALPGVEVDRGDYVEALRKVAAEIEAKRPVNDLCPVMDKKANANKTFVHDGETIAFCCDKCVAKFAKEPAKFLGKLKRRAKKKPKTTAKEPANEKCPVTGKPVDPSVTVVHGGKTIAFCCANCRSKFEKAPEKFAGKLK